MTDLQQATKCPKCHSNPKDRDFREWEDEHYASLGFALTGAKWQTTTFFTFAETDKMLQCLICQMLKADWKKLQRIVDLKAKDLNALKNTLARYAGNENGLFHMCESLMTLKADLEKEFGDAVDWNSKIACARLFRDLPSDCFKWLWEKEDAAAEIAAREARERAEEQQRLARFREQQRVAELAKIQAEEDAKEEADRKMRAQQQKIESLLAENRRLQLEKELEKEAAELEKQAVAKLEKQATAELDQLAAATTPVGICAKMKKEDVEIVEEKLPASPMSYYKHSSPKKKMNPMKSPPHIQCLDEGEGKLLVEGPVATLLPGVTTAKTMEGSAVNLKKRIGKLKRRSDEFLQQEDEPKKSKMAAEVVKAEMKEIMVTDEIMGMAEKDNIVRQESGKAMVEELVGAEIEQSLSGQENESHEIAITTSNVETDKDDADYQEESEKGSGGNDSEGSDFEVQSCDHEESQSEAQKEESQVPRCQTSATMLSPWRWRMKTSKLMRPERRRSIKWLLDRRNGSWDEKKSA
ncbi:unnamed protein product [Amoebophrya sp. A25]|nr:unnamed protein product [Amoebophrya sp. A25]|eukprot:GSA25T00019654001.1